MLSGLYLMSYLCVCVCVCVCVSILTIPSWLSIILSLKWGKHDVLHIPKVLYESDI